MEVHELRVEQLIDKYRKYLLIFRDQVSNIVWKRELARSRGEWDQVVVVDEIISPKSDQNERFVHQPRCLSWTDQGAEPLLVLLKVLQLLGNPDNIYLKSKDKESLQLLSNPDNAFSPKKKSKIKSNLQTYKCNFINTNFK